MPPVARPEKIWWMRTSIVIISRPTAGAEFLHRRDAEDAEGRREKKKYLCGPLRSPRLCGESIGLIPSQYPRYERRIASLLRISSALPEITTRPVSSRYACCASFS